MMRKLVILLGIPIDDLSMEQALDRIESFVETGRVTPKIHQIATVNADFIVKAMEDPELRQLLQEADMATADGMPLVWGARLLGVPLPERVAGADMVPALAKRAADKGYSLFFLGAAPGIAQKAADILTTQNPNLNIAGVISPPYSSILEMDRAILDEIKAAKPDVLLVAFGNPKQEKWIGMYGRELGIPVMIGVGGTFDFIAGNTKRAPEWMQRYGLEWLHRLAHNPRRLFKRYVTDLLGFGSFFIRQWLAMRQGQVPSTTLPYTDVVMVDEIAVLNIQGRLAINNLEGFRTKTQEVLKETNYIVVNLEFADFLDSAAIGALVGLGKQVRDANGEMWLAAIPDTVYRTLQLLRLDKFFSIVRNVDIVLQGQQAEELKEHDYGEDTEDWMIVKAPRRLDAITAEEVTNRCSALLEKKPFLILDFSDTLFLASAGLAVLAELNRKAQKAKGELRVAGCMPDVLRVIQMVRFDKVLMLYEDVNTAIS